MKFVFPFTKIRYVMITFSFLIIGGGLLFTFLYHKDFNWGVDFKGGLSQQIQIAPVAMTVTNQSETGMLDLSISNQDQTLSVIVGDQKQQVLSFKDFSTLDALVKALSGIKGIGVQLVAPGTTPCSGLLGITEKLDSGKKMFLNSALAEGSASTVTIGDLRQILESLYSGASIQNIGEPLAQEFVIRLDADQVKENQQAAGSGQDLFGLISDSIKTQLEKKYGEGTVIVKQQETLGPQLAQNIATGSLVAVILALACMFIYVTIRFQFQYALAAIFSLIHDALFTIMLIGVFQVEVSSAVVAAILTIIGYSINDTIVIFDRIRENQTLMKGADYANIINSSITQTLSRTIVTAVTVALSILPLFILGTGAVKDFSFAMFFGGVISGSYSTIFIAAPVVYGWRKTFLKKQQEQEKKLYGKVQTPSSNEETPAHASPERIVTPENQGEAPLDAEQLSVDHESGSGTGPITRVQRVLEKKKKRHR